MFFALRNLTVPALLLAGTAVFADATVEWTNPSNRHFTISFQKLEKTEGTITFEAGGSKSVWDKNTAEGTSLAWNARQTFKVTYSAGFNKNAHFRLRVTDDNKNWVDFIVKNAMVGAPTVTPDGASAKVEKDEGSTETKGRGGALHLTNKGFWSVKTDGF